MQAEPAGGGRAAVSAGPGPGELLREARESHGLSTEQVADSLHLDESVVEALEAGRFDSVGAPVFVRGHLKAYSRVVQIDEGPLLEAYAALHPREKQDLLAGRQPKRGGFNVNPGPWTIGGVGVLLAVALVVYVFQGDPAPRSAAVDPGPPARLAEPRSLPSADYLAAAQAPDPQPATPAAAAPADDPAPATAAANGPADPADPGLAAGEATPAAQVIPPATPVAGAAPAADKTRLELYFREESWVEISDAEERILFGLQREGMRRQLTGEPPFQVLLGNAAGVDVYLDGEAYPVPRRGRTGKVARFRIDPAGAGGRL